MCESPISYNHKFEFTLDRCFVTDNCAVTMNQVDGGNGEYVTLHLTFPFFFHVIFVLSIQPFIFV